MKKKIAAGAEILFLIISFIFSVYSSSSDNISNKKSGLEELSFGADSVEMVNWQGSDNIYTSENDPQIIINNLNCFVHTVRLSGTLPSGTESIHVFYSDGGDFSEENSFYAPFSIKGNRVYITVDRDASRLRLDITEATGAELRLTNVIINDRSLVFGLNNVMGICVLPSAALGIILFIIVKRKEISPYMDTLKKYIPLLENLISRDLKVKYRRSVLGFLWSILNPLLMALVLNAVFSRLFRFQIEYFATYYLIGSLIFNFVVECTTGSMMSVIGAAPLIKKVYIPKYIFPLEKCVFAFVNMLFGSVAVVVVMLIQGVPFHVEMLLFFLPMLSAFVFAYGMGLMLAAFTVFFRDIEHLYGVWVTIWMYLTPIIYPEDMLVSNGMSVIMKLNPMYYYVHSLRSLVMYGSLPTLSDNIMCVSFAVLFLACGLGLFKKLQDKFVLYI